MTDAVRLAFGTLSVIPLGHPATVTRGTWGRALTLAPFVGAVLGLAGWLLAVGLTQIGAAPLLAGVAGVATLALLTRGLHLDGLADVADGLGSGRPPLAARDVMRRSDIGPFGVVTLVLVLLAQVAVVTQLLTVRPFTISAIGLVGAAVLSRAALTWCGRRGVSAADSEGLGAQVAGSVATPSAVVAVGSSIVLLTSWALVVDPRLTVPVAASALSALLAGEAWRRHCSRRFGGITGDVLGSVEQVTFTSYLLVLAVLLP